MDYGRPQWRLGCQKGFDVGRRREDFRARPWHHMLHVAVSFMPPIQRVVTFDSTIVTVRLPRLLYATLGPQTAQPAGRGPFACTEFSTSCTERLPA